MQPLRNTIAQQGSVAEPRSGPAGDRAPSPPPRHSGDIPEVEELQTERTPTVVLPTAVGRNANIGQYIIQVSFCVLKS